MQKLGHIDELEAATIASAMEFWRANLEADEKGQPSRPGFETYRFVNPSLGTLTPGEIAQFMIERRPCFSEKPDQR